MGGGQKSESSSTTELPPWYVPYAKAGLALGQRVAQKGYTPYYGPDVAAFAPQQVAGMQAANDWSAAFGGKNAKSPNVASQLMPAQNFAGGLKGYSSIGGYQESLKKLRQARPGQYNYISGFGINPRTGATSKEYSLVDMLQKQIADAQAKGKTYVGSTGVNYTQNPDFEPHGGGHHR